MIMRKDGTGMRGRQIWAKAALAAWLALCAGGAWAQVDDQAPKLKGVRLAQAGFWSLALVTLSKTSKMCAASTRDNALNAVFDYIVVNRRVTAFRIGGAAIEARPDAEDVLFVLQVDRRKAIAVRGRKTGAVVLLPVDKDAEPKRRFVRDLAEGKALEVRAEDGELVGRFQLAGAGKVLRAFGLCLRRLPDQAAAPLQ